jgi:hypothetical protein
MYLLTEQKRDWVRSASDRRERSSRTDPANSTRKAGAA